MHAFDVLGDPVRRRILELLVEERSAGDVTAVIRAEFGISQPAVSQHLRVLRENGFAHVRAEGTRRLYAIEPDRLQEVDRWLQPFRQFWEQKLDALGTELARGRRARRSEAAGPPAQLAGDPPARAAARPLASPAARVAPGPLADPATDP